MCVRACVCVCMECVNKGVKGEEGSVGIGVRKVTRISP